MKNKIKILGHEVEYECSDDRVQQYFIKSQIIDEITNEVRLGELEFHYQLSPDSSPEPVTITWCILEPKVLEVSGCMGCPFLHDNTKGYGCNHPDGTGNLYDNTAELFEHCPLKKESITIKLKQDNGANNI